MKCNNCGMELSQDAMFCGNCGAKVVVVQQPICEEISQNGPMLNSSEDKERALACCQEIMNFVRNDREHELPDQDACEQILDLQEQVKELKRKLAHYQCPKCGNDVTPSMKFCNVCGERLGD